MVFHLGGEEETLSEALAVLRTNHPSLSIDGHHGFFTFGSEVAAKVRKTINRIKPDILLVGMGMGRQERWILHNSDLVEVPAIVTVGSVMKLLSGELRTPPRWTGRFGIEWLFRFVQQPRTTFRRYFVEPWQIAWRLTQRRIRVRP